MDNDLRNGLTDAQWNALPQEERNRRFAEWAKRHQAINSAQSVASNTVLAPHADNSSRPVKIMTVELKNGADIKPEPIHWLWNGYIALGKFHILAGMAGCGKTTIGMNFASTVSSGGYFPDGTTCKVGNVIIWSGEDDPRDTLAPRLIASGADISRIFFVDHVKENGKSAVFDPAKHVAALSAAITAAGGASLVIVDPVISAVSGDSHKASDTRRGLQPLVDMAMATRCAVFGITHFSKATEGRSPLDRVTGSQAYGALARVVFVAGKDETNAKEGTASRHVFLRAKSNIGPDQGGFEYTLEQVAVPVAECPGLTASVVRFGDLVEGNAREVLSDMEAEPIDDGGASHEAEAFLIDALAGGALPAKEVQRLAVEAGVAKRTLWRAKKALRVSARKSSMAGGWEWHLPEGE